MKKFIAVACFLAVIVLVSAPILVFAAPPSPAVATSGGGFCADLASGFPNVVKCVIDIFDSLIYLMMAAAVVYTIYGAFIMISSEEKRQTGKDTIMYVIIGLFIMISIWGLVAILDETFQLSGETASDYTKTSLIK
jgi:hypothetical protein